MILGSENAMIVGVKEMTEWDCQCRNCGTVNVTYNSKSRRWTCNECGVSRSEDDKK
jgi:transposase-like protein